MNKPQSPPTVSAQESDQRTKNHMEPVAAGQNASQGRKASLHKQISSSVPASDAVVAWQDDSTVDKSTSEVGLGNSCLVDSASGDISDQQLLSPENGNEKGMSMKHLTCYFWSENGHCKYSEADCLYSHTDTGRLAGPPTQIEPGGYLSLAPAVAGANAKVQDPVYVNWRGHHGLEIDRKKKAVEYRQRCGISPTIQQQIFNINAKAQYNEKHNLWPMQQPQGQPHFGPEQAPGVSSPPYEPPLTPYQPPPGIFEPTPPYSYNEHLSNPVHYHLPPPPQANPADQHGSCEQKVAELQFKLEKSEKENQELRKLVEILGDTVIGITDAEQQIAVAIQNLFGTTGVRLLHIHKKLDDSPLVKHPDMKMVRQEVLKIGKELLTGMSKHRSHLGEVENVQGNVRQHLVGFGEDPEASAKMHGGQGV
ncbi:MAG: hypothetical protein Q9191_002790 [Dirinaria sp. TL-2023a]